MVALLGGAGGSGSMFPFGQAQQPQSPTQQPAQQAGATPFWADPNFIQASMRMQQMMAGGANNNTNTNITPQQDQEQQQQQQQQNLLQQMMMGFPSGGFG